MIKIEKKDDCCGCSACYNICPQNAITMEGDEKGFAYPVVKQELCINCDLCKKVCPILNQNKIENVPYAYACINKNDKVRKESSSGGVFSMLAEEILKNNGVVFGATFDSNYNVIHTYIDNKNELNKFRGSKYVQSTIGSCYSDVKKFLNQGKYVLFTGTPCQIEGLKKYLVKEYEKLYTQDFICHGVPSPLVWKKYLEFRQKKINKKPVNIYFRNKDDGWKEFNMKFEYVDFQYKENLKKDPYLQAFLKNTSLRDSCYNCKFKKINRMSDITLGDFLGVEKVLPEMYDNIGTSLVIINSRKGEELFRNIKENIECKAVEDVNEAIKYNPSMIYSSKIDKNRKKFFENLDILQFDKLVMKYTYKIPIHILVANKCKKIIKKIIKK